MAKKTGTKKNPDTLGSEMDNAVDADKKNAGRPVETLPLSSDDTHDTPPRSETPVKKRARRKANPAEAVETVAAITENDAHSIGDVPSELHSDAASDVRSRESAAPESGREIQESVEAKKIAGTEPPPPSPAPPCASTDYDSGHFASVQAMKTCRGFAPLGMLFVLMDLFNGSEEGLIRVNRLANALSIGKPSLLAQLENLEKAGLIRTVTSSHRGRHVELLTPNLMRHSEFQEAPQDGEEFPLPAECPPGVPSKFSLDVLRKLRAYLSECGIRVVSLPDESKLDPRLSVGAAYLGRYLPHILLFYRHLKGALTRSEEIQFSLRGLDSRDISHTLNFCKMMRDVDFLSDFTYRRAPHYMIVARPRHSPAAIAFLTGGWLEHYIRDRVAAILTTHPSFMEIPFAFMKNPEIRLPGGECFEFDFLLMIDGKVFWIEAKTGQFMDYLKKYSRVAKLLKLNANCAMLVLADSPKPDSNLSARYGLSCCGVDEFAEVFRLALVRELVRKRKK